MQSLRNLLTGAVAAIALVGASTAYAAQTTSAPTAAPTAAATTPSISGQIHNPWLALSMTDPNAAVALAGAALAAQPDQGPPQNNGGFATPPIPVLIIWLAWLGLFVAILAKNHNGHITFTPVSPA